MKPDWIPRQYGPLIQYSTIGNTLHGTQNVTHIAIATPLRDNLPADKTALRNRFLRTFKFEGAQRINRKETQKIE